VSDSSSSSSDNSDSQTYPLQSDDLVSVFANVRRVGAKLYRVLCFYHSTGTDKSDDIDDTGLWSSSTVRVALLPESPELDGQTEEIKYKPVELIDTSKSQADLKAELEHQKVMMQQQNPSTMVVCVANTIRLFH
jgi:hypothetical protein